MELGDNQSEGRTIMPAYSNRAVMRRLTVGLMLSVLGCFLTACEKLLEVENPTAVEADYLEEPEQANLLVASAVNDFECAFGHYIMAGALIGNEMGDTQTLVPMFHYDRRSFTEAGGLYVSATCSDNGVIGVYGVLSTARAEADLAVRVLTDASDAQVPNRAELLATAYAYAGYGRLLLGEGMCSAAIDAGPELSSLEMFALAEEMFTNALNGSPPSDLENMALVGRARARLNQGNSAGALADASLVQPGFVKNAQYSASSDRSSNKVYMHNNFTAFSTVDGSYQNLEWKGTPDLRVPLTDRGRVASDNLSPLWTQEKYTSRAAPIPIARYAEARLIVAEVEGGQSAVDIINELHTAAGLPSYDPTTDGPILDQLILERERELFLESHHLYDIVRFNKQLVPPPGTPYRWGTSTYGNTVCLPLPLAERNSNPNIP